MTGTRCPQKISYPGLVPALDHLIGILRAKGARTARRVYKCNFCLGWHTTSQERRAIRDALVHAQALAILGVKR